MVWKVIFIIYDIKLENDCIMAANCLDKSVHLTQLTMLAFIYHIYVNLNHICEFSCTNKTNFIKAFFKHRQIKTLKIRWNIVSETKEINLENACIKLVFNFFFFFCNIEFTEMFFFSMQITSVSAVLCMKRTTTVILAVKH